MLDISASQHHQLASASRERHVAGLMQRLAERHPDLVATLDPAALRAVVVEAVDAAGSWGFTQRGPIRLYLDLCIAFGSGFVDDPLYPWARAAVLPVDPATEPERAEALFASGCAAVDAIFGPQDEHRQASLEALLRWSRAPAQAPSETGLGHQVISVLAALHPRKAAHAGEEALRALVIDAAEDCSRHGLDAKHGLMLLAVLKFSLGSSCLTDPAYPWIARVLGDDHLPGPPARQDALHRALVAWLADLLPAVAARS